MAAELIQQYDGNHDRLLDRAETENAAEPLGRSRPWTSTVTTKSRRLS